VDKDTAGLRDIGIRGAEALANEELPAIDWRNPRQLADHMGRLDFIASIGKDTAQIFAKQEAELRSSYGDERYDRTFDNLEKAGKVGEALTEISDFYASDAYTIDAEGYARMAAAPDPKSINLLHRTILRGAASTRAMDEYQGRVMGGKIGELNFNPNEFAEHIAMKRLEVGGEQTMEGGLLKVAVDTRKALVREAAQVRRPETPAREVGQAHQSKAPAREASQTHQSKAPAREAITLNELQRESKGAGGKSERTRRAASPGRQAAPAKPQLARPAASTSSRKGH
jgi:hypothetical protein